MCSFVSVKTCDAANAAGGVDTRIQHLPVEVLIKCFTFLPLRQMYGVQRVCRQWRNTVDLVLSTLHQFDPFIVCPVTDSLRRLEEIQVWLQFRDEPHPLQTYHILDDCDLESALKKTPGLKRFTSSVDGRLKFCQSAPFTVADLCPQLVEIRLSRFTVNEHSVLHLCRVCPKLEIVQLSSLGFNESRIEALLRYLPRLRHLDVGKCTTTTGKWLPMLPSTLEKLFLTACRYIKSKDMVRLGEFCSSLTHLDITGMKQIKPDHFSTMLAGLPQLQILSLASVSLESDRWLTQVSDHLTSLDVRCTQLTDTMLPRMAQRLPDLTSLKLGGSSIEPTEAGLLQLVQFKHLSKLTIDSSKSLTDAVLDALQLMSISEFHIFQLPVHPSVDMISADGLMRFIAGSQLLTLLDLCHVCVASEQLLRKAALQISPGRWMQIRRREDDRLLSTAPEPFQNNTARLLVVIFGDYWFPKIRI